MNLTETIARAIASSFGVKADVFPRYENEARYIISALTEAGYAIVPREPTEAMSEIGASTMQEAFEEGEGAKQRAALGYCSMIAASPDHIMPPIQEPGPLESGEGE